jgi:nitrite reductase/ring-hydroxylating ferredoxin subunit
MDIPDNRCRAVGDGAAIVVKVDGVVRAFQNRCLHQNSPLEGGVVLHGTLICPLHFWRYRLPSGRHVGSDLVLPSFPVDTVDGEVFVEVPDPEPASSMRELLLRHAREWKPGQ